MDDFYRERCWTHLPQHTAESPTVVVPSLRVSVGIFCLAVEAMMGRESRIKKARLMRVKLEGEDVEKLLYTDARDLQEESRLEVRMDALRLTLPRGLILP